jgi:hypothetical protein
MRDVRAATAARMGAAADAGNSGVWCSPTPNQSSPTSSARTATSTTLRIACASETCRPVAGSAFASPKTVIPSSMPALLLLVGPALCAPDP